jgi:lysozyme family protein
MAKFKQAFAKLIKNEGGWVNDPDDSGGETYRGIARKYNEVWIGWEIIDELKSQKLFPESLNKNDELNLLVEDFYRINYWDKIKADEINNQKITESIFDFAVNAGIKTSVRLAQKVINASSDGIIGENSLGKINLFGEREFINNFVLEKIKRYVSIVE